MSKLCCQEKPYRCSIVGGTNQQEQNALHTNFKQFDSKKVCEKRNLSLAPLETSPRFRAQST